MELADRPARYLTLRDYLRVIRRYWIAIVAITAIGALAGFLTAEAQSSTYQATASIYFQDPAQQSTLVGFPPGLVQTPATLAALNAETFARPEVMDVVKQRLNTSASRGALASALSAAVSTGGQLQLTASASTPSFSALLANTTARVVVEQTNRQAQQTYALAADEIRSQITRIQANPTAPGAVQRLNVFADEVARLQTLSKFAQAARISVPASVPGGRSSPKVLRSTLIGLGIGLLLALAVAFFRDTLDRRLRTAQEVESAFQLPVLAHVRNQVMGRIPHAERTKQDESDFESFRILRRNLQFLNIDSPPRSIIVTSGVAEEGKTTVVGSLAFATAAAGKRTLLVDCDLRRPALASRLGLETVPGMSDFLLGEAAPTQILRTIATGETVSFNGADPEARPHPLVVIPAGSPTSHASELLGSQKFKDFLQQVLDTYEVVVIDASPLLPVADTLEMLPSVDAVVVCARESRTTRDEALAVRTALERFPSLPIGLVITGVTPTGDNVMYTHSYSSQQREERVPSSTT